MARNSIDWPEQIGDLGSVRKLNSEEIQWLRGRGNHGALERIRIGLDLPICGSDAIRNCRFEGWNILLHSETALADSDLEKCLVSQARIGRSTLVQSLIGPGSIVRHGAVISNSLLLPFNRKESLSGKESIQSHAVSVNASQISDSILWGGTDAGPYVHVRANSVVGPFVHLGTGSELKAAYIRGASPLSTVEIPHRAYVGNAVVQSIHINKERKNPGFNAELGEKLAAMLFGEVKASVLKELAPGGFHSPEHLTVDFAGAEVALEVEGVNLGALFTTSNFEPRWGGIKWPTEIGAGAKLGIGTVAQAPVIIADNVLVASGAKISGANIPPGSLVLGGPTTMVKEGYVTSNDGLLGRGTVEAADTVRLILEELATLAQVALAGFSRPSVRSRDRAFSQLGYQREALAICAQLGELGDWYLRFLKLVALSRDKLRIKIEQQETRQEDRERLRARLEEQTGLAGECDTRQESLARLKQALDRALEQAENNYSFSKVLSDD